MPHWAILTGSQHTSAAFHTNFADAAGSAFCAALSAKKNLGRNAEPVSWDTFDPWLY